MAAPIDPAQFKETLIVLGAAAVVIPVFHRLKLSPLLGFILVGVAVGPFGLGALQAQAPWLSWLTIADPKSIATMAELGVAMLLFMIGLELSFERLSMMRRLVFGLGPLQMVLCAVAIAGVALALGQPMSAAIVLGLALAVSSTAVVIQSLADAKKLTAPVGRKTFAVLLFQDLAVVPIMFVVAMMGAQAGASLPVAIGQAILGVAAILIAGRLLLRPLFRQVARTGSPELFMSACLLVILGAGLAATLAGLSLALGALIAGVLLAETEYRRQIEVMIEPFKGLLLGVFLITVGMGLDLSKVLAAPGPILAGAAGLVVLKGAIIYALLRRFSADRPSALQGAALLAPGSEFTFVIIGAAALGGVLAREVADYALTLAALTMALIPMLFGLAQRFGVRAVPIQPTAEMVLPDQPAEAPRVIITGFGRVGEVVAQLLERHNVAYVAVDSNIDVVSRARKLGKPVYFGDVANAEFLRRCHLETAKALVVTMDSPKAVADVVAAARGERADLMIVARARDAQHAAKLYALGATDAVPETVESSLQLSETVLVDVGVPMGHAIASIHDMRALFRAEMQAAAPGADISLPKRKRLRDFTAPKGEDA
jgi:CPA2 family monovalent cation:H+ antiporter-2